MVQTRLNFYFNFNKHVNKNIFYFLTSINFLKVAKFKVNTKFYNNNNYKSVYKKTNFLKKKIKIMKIFKNSTINNIVTI